jgi:hypothetical protein
MSDVARAVRYCPLTVALTAALVGVGVFLQARPRDLPGAVAWASTNLHNLASHPVGALLASAVVTTRAPWVGVVIVAVSCCWLERRVGTLRTAAVALAGQVIATVLTEYGADAFAADHLSAASSPLRPDVGLSYVMYALLGAAALLVPTRWRRPALAALILAVGVPLAVAPGMTTTGHLLALACGVGAITVSVWRRGRSQPPQRVQERWPRSAEGSEELAVARLDRAVRPVGQGRALAGDPQRAGAPVGGVFGAGEQAARLQGAQHLRGHHRVRGGVVGERPLRHRPVGL